MGLFCTCVPYYSVMRELFLYLYTSGDDDDDSIVKLIIIIIIIKRQD